MVKQPIRNLHSDKPIQPHWCSVIYDEEHDVCYLERKDKKTKAVESIPWEDVKYQVESFIETQKAI